jgi:hypothetical protein
MTRMPIAALLMLMPLLFAAADLRSGIALSYGVAATFGLLMMAARLTRTTPDSAFGLGLWSTLAAAVSSWALAAWIAPEPAVIAALPVAAASFAMWPSAGSNLLPLSFIAPSICAPIAIGALRSAADAMQRDQLGSPLAELLSWSASPAGLLIVAALGTALFQALRHRPAPTEQDTPTA